MSRRWRMCILCGAFLALAVVATSVILVSRASTKPAPQPNNNEAQSRRPRQLRNLVLQPEAAAVNRKLGNRFKSDKGRSVLVGTITMGSERQTVMIIRSQTDSGETVDVDLGGRKLNWTEAEGMRATAGAVATEAERVTLERLVFDSPDQFVLAQLRGASYQTIVRNLRPTDAGDDYAGPLWTMVRVNDPQTGESAAARSPWRLYFINSQSGLIDRIESDLDGQRVEASILQWTDQNGEKVPSHIRWTMNGGTVMEYQLASFSQGE
jgi:hypothetical protein